MTRKFVMPLMLFAMAALAIASSSTYSVTLTQPSIVAGTELKAGDYKLSVENDKVTFIRGKERVEATAKTETAPTKFASTAVRYTTTDGKFTVQEIRLGGTYTKLVFN